MKKKFESCFCWYDFDPFHINGWPFALLKKKKKKGSGVIGVEEEWDKKCLNFNRDKFNFNKREWTSIIYVLTHRVKEEITVMHSKLVNNNLELSEDAKLLQIYD